MSGVSGVSGVSVRRDHEYGMKCRGMLQKIDLYHYTTRSTVQYQFLADDTYCSTPWQHSQLSRSPNSSFQHSLGLAKKGCGNRSQLENSANKETTSISDPTFANLVVPRTSYLVT